ncbi:hypothetical protein Tco_0046782 [Tanacetum coccineum]
MVLGRVLALHTTHSRFRDKVYYFNIEAAHYGKAPRPRLRPKTIADVPTNTHIEEKDEAHNNTNRDVPQRLCNSAKLKFYFGGFFSGSSSNIKPNRTLACPLGSHCPTATLDRDTGMCKPYTYQQPPAMPNHTCGGANIWADIKTSGELFCSKRSYCPTSTQEFSIIVKPSTLIEEICLLLPGIVRQVILVDWLENAE